MSDIVERVLLLLALAAIVLVYTEAHVATIELERLEKRFLALHGRIVTLENTVGELDALLERQVTAAELAAAIVNKAEKQKGEEP